LKKDSLDGTKERAFCQNIMQFEDCIISLSAVVFAGIRGSKASTTAKRFMSRSANLNEKRNSSITRPTNKKKGSKTRRERSESGKYFMSGETFSSNDLFCANQPDLPFYGS
jgi:hypothetical protein